MRPIRSTVRWLKFRRPNLTAKVKQRAIAHRGMVPLRGSEMRAENLANYIQRNLQPADVDRLVELLGYEVGE